jgi:3-oxoadipate enol-lactonase
MRSTYISDESQLTYYDAGAGMPAVVFLHPTPLNGEYWRPLIERLPQVRAIAPDFRGHGASELGTRLPAGEFAQVPDAPVLSMGQLASDVLALLDHLKLGQAVFAGCSIGGYVLLELWRRAPERMQGLTFVCSKPQPDAEVGLAKREATIAQARAGKTAELFDGFAQNLVGATTRTNRPEMVRALRAQMTLTPDAEVAVQAGLAARPDSVPTVASITVPVLAIAGSEDTSVTPAEMEAFCAAPGGCRYEVLKDAGHFAAYEQPEKIAELMSAWLRQVGQAD